MTKASTLVWLSRFGLSVWISAFVFYAWWSYALVDTNLTLFSNPMFTRWQASRWDDLVQPDLIAWQYAGVVLALWSGFLMFLARLSLMGKSIKFQTVAMALGVSVFLLMLAQNPLSRDIYNYLFNAKMVVAYQANPHLQSALDFPQDPWIRFMHNVHTPAPYGYLWTAWSLIPFIASGLGQVFIVSYVFMRLWMVLGWLALLAALWWALSSTKENRLWRWSLFALNPLVLIEVLSNGHNDVWMMLPAVLAWGIALSVRRTWHWLAIAVLLGISIWFKFATVVCLPVFGLLLLSEVLPMLRTPTGKLAESIRLQIHVWGADLLAVAMVVPLFTMRSQQFHPWYAVWFLAWVPFVRQGWLRWTLIGLSFTSQLRYLPWLLAGQQYSPAVFDQARMITWSGAFLGLVLWAVWKLIPKRK